MDCHGETIPHDPDLIQMIRGDVCSFQSKTRIIYSLLIYYKHLPYIHLLKHFVSPMTTCGTPDSPTLSKQHYKDLVALL